MADTLALEKLYQDVVARFAAEGTACDNFFGWRVPAQQVLRARIAWVPGDPSGSIVGEESAARNPGRNPRPIATLRELFQVIISAADLTAPENELLQYKAARLLRDAWHRAAYLAAHGTLKLVSETWIVDKNERRFGASIRVVCAIESMVPDEPLETAPVDTSAVINVATLDKTETLTVSPADAP